MKKNLLIICFSVNDINRISDIDLAKYEKVIVASDELKVHEYCKKFNLIDKFTFLNKPISYPTVSIDVMKMIDKVNSYLDKVSKLGIFSRKELFWNYHVEGSGYTTQRIQDILIAIECAYLILDEYLINELIIIGHDNEPSINAIKKLAIKKGLNVSYINRKKTFDRNKLKSFTRTLYLLLRSLICKISSSKIEYFNNDKIVLFQICGSSTKHVQNAIFPQKKLLKNRLTPLNIIWGNTREVKKINKKGFKAIALENYLTYTDFFVSFFKTLKIFIEYKHLKNLFNHEDTFTYKSIDVKDVVCDTVIEYLYIDGPENYRYRVAAERFVLEYTKNIVAIKYCAVKSLTQSTILSEIFEDRYLKFDYDVGLRMRDQYDEYNSKKHQNFLINNFIRFTPNKIEKKNLIEDMNISDRAVILFGNGRASNHFKNLDTLSKEDSMRILGIKNNHDIYILLDLQSPSAGYNSVEEIIHLLKTLVEFVDNKKNIALIIKPYPSANFSWLSNLIRHRSENIYLLDKKQLPDHALNVADVIFCKFSTMGVESMIYDTQVVSILLDKEKTFKVFGNSAEYIYEKEELKSLLKNIFSSQEIFIKWKNSYKEKRNKFIQTYYPKLHKSSDEIIVETLEKKLNERFLNEKNN